MGNKTKIEWTDASWTPIRARHKETGKVGWHCEHDSEGCRFCYAEGINKRLGTGLDFKPGHRKDVDIFLDAKMLMLPLRWWRQPRMIFVCSMTDLFADFVPDECVDALFAVMMICPQHTFQVLTKRMARARAYCSDPATVKRISDKVCDMALMRGVNAVLIAPGMDPELAPKGARVFLGRWPLPNVWLGVSCEDQENADARIPDLLSTPAAVRFVSAEPLLGPIEFAKVPGFNRVNLSLRNWWVIVGGESGPKARPMHPDWARSIRDQCAAAGVPYFFKQFGEWHPCEMKDGACYPMPGHEPFDSWKAPIYDADIEDGWNWRRLGKKAAGRLLDGREHNDMPAGLGDVRRQQDGII